MKVKVLADHCMATDISKCTCTQFFSGNSGMQLGLASTNKSIRRPIKDAGLLVGY